MVFQNHCSHWGFCRFWYFRMLQGVSGSGGSKSGSELVTPLAALCSELLRLSCMA